jgi:hypothetical protein
MLEMARQELREVVEIMAAVKVWITLLVPPISDGGNFGAQVQVRIIPITERSQYKVVSGPSEGVPDLRVLGHLPTRR